MKIAFIGFGEAGRAFVQTLRAREDLSFTAYDILTARGADADVRSAASALNVRIADSPAEAAGGADWVISAVTAADSLDAGRSVAGILALGQVFIDINSVTAERKRRTAELTGASGAAYLDMAVMAPVHPRGHATPVLIAGPACASIAPQLAALGFDFSVVSDEIGAAASIKMIRSLFVKGMEAVTVQALLAARAAGCFDRVHGSLEKSFPDFGWPAFGRYQLERVATHGIRRAAEMRESAATMRELGFAAGGQLGDAIAALQEEIGRLGCSIEEDRDLPSALDEILGSARTD